MASNVDLDPFKRYLGTELSRNDDTLQVTLDAAERAVFQWCRRRIVAAAVDAVATTRVFVPTTRWLVDTDDFVSVDAVADDGTAVDPAGYQLEPLNGLSVDGEYRPYSSIRRTTSSWSGAWSSGLDPRNRLPGEATVSVTAVWGWASVPDPIVLATLMVGKDLRAAKDTTYGIAQFTDYAAIRIRENPSVQMMLEPYRKDVVLLA